MGLKKPDLRGPWLGAIAVVLVLGAGGPAHADKIEQALAALSDIDDAKALRLLGEVIADPAVSSEVRADAYYNRGEVHLAARNQEAALADFNMALATQTQPSVRALILVSRAELYARQRKDSEALADYAASLEIAPGQIGVLTARGALYQRMGDKPAALADFDAELKLRPTFFKALTGRAVLLGEPLPPYERRW